MKSEERKKAIALLEQKVALYDKLVKSGTASKSDLINYHDSLEELAKLKRIEASFQDIMYFAKTYFAGSSPTDLLQDHTPSPPFHYEIAGLLREIAVNEWGSKLAIAAPRSHSKSTLVSNIFLTWLALFAEDTNRYYFVLISDKQAVAGSQLAVVKTALESNEKLRADFGAMETKTWNAFEIVLANGVKIQSAGSGEALRGLRHQAHRPNVILDDCEGADNVSTPEQINKMLAWFDQTIANLGDPKRSFFIIIGTVLHYQSLLATLLYRRPDWKSRVYSALVKFPDNMHLWDEWQRIYHSRIEGDTPAEATQLAGEKALRFYEEYKKEMDEGAEVLWPERMDLYAIMLQRATNPLAFSTELQNNPVDSDSQVFKHYVTYDPAEVNVKDLVYIFAAVDPSLRETKRSDPSVIITIGKSKQGIYYVLDVDNRKRAPDVIIDDLLRKAVHYEYKWASVESIAFQQFFAEEVRKRSAVAGIYLDVREFKSTVQKEIRITSLEPLITNGFIRFAPNQLELIEQLTYFPKVKHDDILDALAQAIEMDRKKSGRLVVGKLY